MLLTPRSQGSRHGRLGHVPKVFDSWITDGGGSGKWQNMRVSPYRSHQKISLPIYYSSRLLPNQSL